MGGLQHFWENLKRAWVVRTLKRDLKKTIKKMYTICVFTNFKACTRKFRLQKITKKIIYTITKMKTLYNYICTQRKF